MVQKPAFPNMRPSLHFPECATPYIGKQKKLAPIKYIKRIQQYFLVYLGCDFRTVRI